MTILVVGASGATGRLVVEKLLAQGEAVRIIVRSSEYLANKIKNHPLLSITIASLLDLTDEQLKMQVSECKTVVSCLGHNISFKGIYGQPRRLVTHAVQRLCYAIEQADSLNSIPTQFILMSSAGVQNQIDGEKVPFSQAVAINIIRYLVPPHADNEAAADYLKMKYSQNQTKIEWVVVRPDTLIDEFHNKPFTIHKAPIRNVIFNAGSTSRINVAHFIATLACNSDTWNEWKMRMPVIYNQ